MAARGVEPLAREVSHSDCALLFRGVDARCSGFTAWLAARNGQRAARSARDLLRRRLTARGVTLSTTALASHLALAEAKAGVPESLRMATLKAAWAVAGHTGLKMTVASSVSVSIASLVDGVIQSMRLTQVGTVTLPLLLVAGAIATGVVVGAPQLANDPPGGQTTPRPASGGAATTQVKSSAPNKQASQAMVKGVDRRVPQRSTGSSSNSANSPAQSPAVNSAPMGGGFMVGSQLPGGMGMGGMGGGGMMGPMGGGVSGPNSNHVPAPDDCGIGGRVSRTSGRCSDNRYSQKA